MSYLALARKYRPRRFAEVSTQEHVSETLKHALASDRVAHAYLFCGPKGVGKTTLARILAMALNCRNREADGEPCGSCEDCARIWGGHTSLDVVEIDAASNRGVDDARELRERAMYSPSEEGRHKVYILDEAHMLTREAWNALLKILEEPPPRVIFVFATTEAQKIQQTASPILSRCQRFDFRRIGAAAIVSRLAEVLEKEGITHEPEALSAIARKADGGMRDGLSLLDQVLALSGDDVTAETAVRVLGVVAEERYLELFDLLAAHRHASVFDFVEGLLDEGYDLVEFYHGLAERLRLLLRISLDPGATTGSAGSRLHEALKKRAALFSSGDLMRMLAMVSELEAGGSLRRTGRPRVLVEMLLLRMSYLDRTVDLEEIIRALGGAPEPASAVREDRPRPGRRAATAKPKTASGCSGAASESAPAEPATPEPTPGTAQATPTPAPAPRPAPAPAPDLATAWTLAAKSARTPPGTKMYVRAARARERDGKLILAVPPGGGEVLGKQSVRQSLQSELALYWRNGSVEIQIEEDGAGSDDEARQARVSPEGVRVSRITTLIQRAPHLEKAVKELDLCIAE